MLSIIIADSELELIPKQLVNYPLIRRLAKKRGKKPWEMILDSSKHHPVMKGLKGWRRRGRPDIIHICLLSALDMPLCKEGLLKIYVHTRHNKVIYIDPNVRLPRNYDRFIGLFEQLFKEGKVPPNATKPLLEIKDKGVDDLIKEINPDIILVFSEKGEQIDLSRFFKENKDKHILVIVGGFPHGDYLSDVYSIADKVVKVYSETLCAWTVLNLVISAYSLALGII